MSDPLRIREPNLPVATTSVTLPEPRGASTGRWRVPCRPVVRHDEVMGEPRAYIHELVDITGHNRTKYFQHITANWAPMGFRDREQLCFGIWGTVGSTGRWPEVLNLWEYRDWAHLGENFRIECNHPSMQDPALAGWWAAAEGFRRGGYDRVLLSAPFSPSIGDLLALGVRGELYAHDLVSVAPGTSPAYLDLVAEHAIDAHREAGATLVGAFRTALVDDAEVVLLWAYPDWATWADGEAAADRGGPLGRWRATSRSLTRSSWRMLLVDAPLSPMRIGRQPAVSDRVDWVEPGDR